MSFDNTQPPNPPGSVPPPPPGAIPGVPAPAPVGSPAAGHPAPAATAAYPPAAYPPAGQLAPAGTSEKSFIATWLLSWLIGVLGIDRFYLGKVGTGIAKLLTLGGLGVWWLVDLIITLTGNATDAQGRKVRGQGKEPMIAWIVTGAVIVLGIIVNAINGADASSDLTAPPAAERSTAEESAEPAPTTDDRETVPGLAGKTVADARAAVEGAGFVLIAPEGTGDDWTVLTQSITEGSRADPGAEVTVTAEAPKPVLTLSQQNAVGKAQDYLDFSGFSRSGLIDQLEYEGFSTDDAAFAADFVGADWNAEAAEKAEDYLGFSSFSRQGLYDQLAFEGFEPGQIEFALTAVGY